MITENKCGLKPDAPTRSCCELTATLEGVPDAELHDPRLTLNTGEIRPVSRYIGKTGDVLRIQSYSITGATAVDGAHPLCVSHVEGLEANLQFVILAPRQAEGLTKPHVQIEVPG